MPKPKKESHPISVRMATDVYDRMKDYCTETGVPKTAMIERAINMYLDNYDETQKQIKRLRSIC